MLPGSFQMPAAVILVVGGLCSCFAGYRIFRFVLAFFGFVFGALFVSSAMGSDQTLWMVGASLLGGLIGALILFAVVLRRRGAHRRRYRRRPGDAAVGGCQS